MKTIIQFDPEKCSGCWACTMTCADQNDLLLGRGDEPYRLVNRVETGKPGLDCITYIMDGCMHCEDAACMAACRKKCFSRTERGLVLYDSTNCVGCGLCIRACPHNAIHKNADGRISKCNGCAERVAAGMQPACEKICPTGAIVFHF